MSKTEKWQKRAVPALMAIYEACLEEGRFDGYAYVRHASVVMPRYFNSVDSQDARESARRMREAILVLHDWCAEGQSVDAETVLAALQHVW